MRRSLLIATLTATLVAMVCGCQSERSEIGSRQENLEASPALLSPGTPLFTEITSQVGIGFQHQPGDFGHYFLPEIMGGGAAMFDFDQDGDLDIFLLNTTSHPLQEGASGKKARNRLYRQDDEGRFEDVTKGSNLEDPGSYAMGVTVGDVNNDGLPDLYLTNYGADRLFLNAGDGEFTDVTSEAGIENLRWGTSAQFLDYDQDGWLDLFVANFLDYTPGDPCVGLHGGDEYCGPSRFPRTRDVLYRNLGAAGQAKVRFEDVTESSGIGRKKSAGLGVVATDFNGDGRSDIYVANDSHANMLWMNQGDGTFRDQAVLFGVAYDRLGRGQASMGLALSDLNDDARPDLVATHLDGENNALYVSEGDFYHDHSTHSGISKLSFPYTGWGAAFLDIDHDADLDLLVVNGRIARRQASVSTVGNPWAQYSEANQLLIQGGALVFQGVAVGADAFTKDVEMSRGLACGDIDNDGDLDVLVTNIGGPARLFRNDAEKRGKWLTIRVVDPRYGGREAYGAWVSLHLGEQVLRQPLNPGPSYLCSHDTRVHFGLGSVDKVDSIHVRWPDGVTEVFPGVSTSRFVTLSRGEGEMK